MKKGFTLIELLAVIVILAIIALIATPSEDSNTINLIMDQNINSDGTSAEMTGIDKGTNSMKYNLVPWMSDSDYGCGSDGDKCSKNDKGPITAMNFLYNATKDWTNISPLNYIYNDRVVQNSNEGIGYTSFVSINGVATLTSLSGNEVVIGSKTEPLRARMPIYAPDEKTEVKDKTDASFLYDNLDSSGSAAPYGYWTLSSYSSRSQSPVFVSGLGGVRYTNVYSRKGPGVRPVITVLF